MNISRSLIEEAVREARLVYRNPIIDEVPGWGSFGVEVADAGEAFQLTAAISSIVGREHNDFVYAMLATAYLKSIDGTKVLIFDGYRLEG